MLIPCSVMFIPCSVIFIPCSVMFIPCSVMFIPCSVMFIPCSVRFIPCSVRFIPCSVMFIPCSVMFNLYSLVWSPSVLIIFILHSSVVLTLLSILKHISSCVSSIIINPKHHTFYTTLLLSFCPSMSSILFFSPSNLKNSSLFCHSKFSIFPFYSW